MGLIGLKLNAYQKVIILLRQLCSFIDFKIFTQKPIA